MRLTISMVAAFGVACLVAVADDPNAPLAEAKQQLQSLRKDDAAQKAGTPAGVKLDLPSLSAQEPNSATPSPRHDARAGQEKGKKARRDWLLDGFNKLERRKPSDGGAVKAQQEREAEETPLDPSDPDYFLRVYERQRAQAEAKQLEANASDAKLSASSAPDPLASFLKEWLADSPVRDALKDSRPTDNSARDGTTAASEGAAGPRNAPPAAGPPVDDRAGRSAAGANPFVQALGLPSFDQPRQVDARPTPTEAVLPASTTSAAPNTVYDLPERAKPDLKRALPPPPSEDKKFFPQLKKF